MTVKCLWCGKLFERKRIKQRFCSAECRVAWNNHKKLTGIHLPQKLLVQLQDIADAQEVAVDEMLAIMLHKILNPDREPLNYDEVFGIPDKENHATQEA